MMIFGHSNYREFLRAELVKRSEKNPKFSLRAFAKKIGISPSLLSLVLSGKKNLSRETTHLTATALGLPEKEAEYFQVLVDLSKTRHPEIQSELHKHLDTLAPKTKRPKDLSLEYFRLISDWYHYPIFAALDLNGFEFNSQSISKRFGITVHEAQSAIERLLRLELISKDSQGRYTKSDEDVLASANVPNEGLRKFHRQMLEKAMQSLETQTPKEKLVGSETFAFSKEGLPEASKIIEECFQKLIACSKKQKTKNQVYHLGIQFFQLMQPKQEKKP